MRYFIELSYNGTSYHGWQRQPNAISVQEVVEDVLVVLLREETSIVGAGRTDAGVHAKQLIAHFDSETVLDTKEFCNKLNSMLPPEIAVVKVYNVSSEAHARFDAIAREYEYRITLNKDPFTITGSYYVRRALDLERMNMAAKILLNYTNFKCFSKSKTDVKTYYCTVTKASWEIVGHELVFTIAANRFLRNMVRAIVGTLLEIGMHKLPVEGIHDIIKSEDRARAGYSVPAHGLYLTKVIYPEAIYKK